MSTAGSFDGSHTYSAGGVYVVTVTLTDDDLGEATQTFSVTVEEDNSPPVLDPIGDQTVPVGDTLTFTASAADPESPPQQLTFSLDPGSPEGAAIDPVTGEFTWTANQGNGQFPLTIRVTDDGWSPLSDSETIVITAGAANQPPVLNTVADQTVDENELLSFVATALDSDGPVGDLWFSLAGGAPQGAAIDPITGRIHVDAR